MVNNPIAHVNVRHVRMKYAKATRKSWPMAKKYLMTIPANRRFFGPTIINYPLMTDDNGGWESAYLAQLPV
jgi:hypothetical protein